MVHIYRGNVALLLTMQWVDVKPMRVIIFSDSSNSYSRFDILLEILQDIYRI